MLKKITILEALNKCMTTIKEYIGLVADKKVDKVEGKCLTTNDLTDQLVENYNTAYNHSQQVHAPSNAQKNSDITKAEIEAKLTGQIDTHFHDLSEDLSEYDRRLDVSENKIENINQEITNTIKPTLNTHETKLNNIEAINTEQNNRLENIEIKNQEQDNRINALETNDKIQDLNIKALFTTSDIMDIEEEGNSLPLHNSKRGFAIIDEIKGNTLVNCNKEPDKELILNGNINDSADNTVTITEGVDGGLVDVALEGNTLVNVSKTKNDYITPSMEKVDQGSVITLPEEGYVSIGSIEGNTLVNYCTDGAKELTLNGDIDVEGNFVTTTEGADNGLVDVMCEGNTLVNLMTDYKTESLLEYFYPVNNMDVANINMLKPNTVYTLIYTAKYQKTGDDGYLVIQTTNNRDEDVYTNQNLTESYIQYSYRFTTLSSVNHFVLRATSSYFYIKECMLLEGDWTNKEIPPYFESMKSVGQDDVNGHKIEILSKNKNLFDGVVSSEYSNPNINFNVSSDGVLSATNKTLDDRAWSYDRAQYRMKLKKGNYTITLETITPSTSQYAQTIIYKKGVTDSLCIFGRSAMDRVGVNSQQISLNEDTDIGIESKMFDGTFRIQIEKGSQSTTFTPYKLNKKEILLNEPLRGLPNGVKDRFVKIGGKWFIERNCGEVTLNGTENWVIFSTSTQSDNNTLFGVDIGLKTDKSNQLLCDKFNKTLCWIDVSQEGIQSGRLEQTGFDIRINNNRLNSVSVEGFKTWLQNNNVTVVYGLATPTYEPLEIEPTLNTYNEVTHISNNSVIPCNMKVKNTGYNAIIKPSTQYTVALDTNKAGTIGINLGGAKVTTTNNVLKLTTPATLTDDSLRLYGKGIKGSKVRLLEGDKTNWIPSFFEGMKSSFEDKVQEDGSYKMEIVSNNKNLFDLSNISIEDKGALHTIELGVNNGIKLTSTQDNQGWMYSTLKFTTLKPSTTYTFRCNITKTNPNSKTAISLYRLLDNSSYGILYESGSFTFTTPKVGTEYIRLLIYSSIDNVPTNQGDVVYFEDIQISEVAGEYVKNKSNKIQFSSIEPLRGVGNIKDKFVFKDNKLMIQRNCKQIAIQNSDIDTLVISNNLCSDNYLIFCMENLLGRIENDRFSIKSNKFATRWTLDGNSKSICEGIFGEQIIGYSTRVYVSIDKKRLTSLDKQGVVKWLVDNKVYISYLLEEPTYEEVPFELQKIILEGYENGTLFIDTNIPPTKVSFNCFEEELTYLYPATSYTVQFVSGKNITADITLGGASLLAQSIVKGLNKITMTTPSELVDNKLVINGVGANISKVVVTDTNREFSYFEGMKSVGECEGNKIEVLAQNKNLFDGTPTSGYESLFNVSSDGVLSATDKTADSRAWDYNMTQYRMKLKKGNYTITLETITPATNEYAQTIIYKKGENDPLHRFFEDAMNAVGIYSQQISLNEDAEIGIESKMFDGEYRIQIEKGSTATDYIPHQSNTQQLTHEPLRAVGDVKDRYVLIDGKWYIERNCGEVTFDENIALNIPENQQNKGFTRFYSNTNAPNKKSNSHVKCDKMITSDIAYFSEVNFECVGGFSYNIYLYIQFRGDNLTIQDIKNRLKEEPITMVYELATPTYKPIEYNPFEVYSDVTHISANSTIPCNVTVKNHGYNCILKPSTTYTVVSNQGVQNMTTPATLGDSLRFSGNGLLKDVMILEGTLSDNQIPGFFAGMESCYEQKKITDEHDEHFGYYEVTAKVVGKNKFNYFFAEALNKCPFATCDNNGVVILNGTLNYHYMFQVTFPAGTYISSCDPQNAFDLHVFWDGGDSSFNKSITYSKVTTVTCYIPSGTYDNKIINTFQIEEGTQATEYEPYKESVIKFYIKDPLRGVGEVKDKVFIQDDKVIVQRNCGVVTFDGSDDEGWLCESPMQYTTYAVCVFDSIKGGELINDKVPSYNYSIYDKDIEGMYTTNDPRIKIKVSNSKLLTLDINGFKQWIQANPITLVYPLEEPTYEEVEYFDSKLYMEIFNNSTLFYNSNIPVTSKAHYSYSVPLVDKVSQTANISDEQDSMIIDLATQCAVMEIMLM